MNALENEYTITFRDKNDDSVTITSTGNLKIHSTKAHDKFYMTLECDDWEVVEKNIKYSAFTFEPVKDLHGIDQKDELYTPREQALIFNAMQWAVKEITGRVMRETFTDVMVEDFIKEFSNK